MHACVCVLLRIVSTDRILHFINTCIIIILLFMLDESVFVSFMLDESVFVYLLCWMRVFLFIFYAG